MLLSTPGLVLHTTPYSESSVVAKVFTRQLGQRSYIIKGVRGRGGRVKQNLLQPLSCLDMVVYDNPKTDLNYIKEISPRHPLSTVNSQLPTQNALRFFMTEVLYKALREAEPMPALFDYVEETSFFCSPKLGELSYEGGLRSVSHLPVLFLLTVSHHLGIEPLDNYSLREPLFDLQEGRFLSAPTETTLSPELSTLLHEYHHSSLPTRPSSLIPHPSSLEDRIALINALLSYYHLHLSGFAHFHSHEILHTILK